MGSRIHRALAGTAFVVLVIAVVVAIVWDSGPESDTTLAVAPTSEETALPSIAMSTSIPVVTAPYIPADIAAPLGSLARIPADLIELPVGYFPRDAAFGHDKIWVLAEKFQLRRSGNPRDVGYIIALDPVSLAVLSETRLEGGPVALGVGVHGVWVGHRRSGEVTLLDASSGEVLDVGVITGDLRTPRFAVRDLDVESDRVWLASDKGEVAVLIRGSTTVQSSSLLRAIAEYRCG